MIKEVISSGLQSVMGAVLTGSPLPPAVLKIAMTAVSAASNPLTRPLVKGWYQQALDASGVSEDQVLPLLAAVPGIQERIKPDVEPFEVVVLAIDSLVKNQAEIPRAVICKCPECDFTFARDITFS